MSRGFTLTELLIVLAIVALLASIAVPSYQDHVAKTRRADAQAALVELANFMERNFTVNGRYNTGAGNSWPTLPFTESPKDGSPKFYDITLQGAASATTFTLRATPKNGQAGNGRVELDHTGARRWDENDDGDFTDAGEADWRTGTGT